MSLPNTPPQRPCRSPDQSGRCVRKGPVHPQLLAGRVSAAYGPGPAPLARSRRFLEGHNGAHLPSVPRRSRIPSSLPPPNHAALVFGPGKRDTAHPHLGRKRLPPAFPRARTVLKRGPSPTRRSAPLDGGRSPGGPGPGRASPALGQRSACHAPLLGSYLERGTRSWGVDRGQRHL